jgi:hypothetical protein
MWVEGMETGHGRHSWNDGSYFEGDWVGGQQNGHGTYVWKSGNWCVFIILFSYLII